ncbi:MAG: ribonuclease H [Candidatus Gracilibacteria bacterium]
MKQIEIFTDGSCKGNPGPGGWCAILLEKKSEKPFKILKGNAVDTTNNRMEMTAVIEALRFIDHEKMHGERITLYSDSNLVIQTLLQGWKRKANLDLWEELDELNEELDVDYVWVKGHAKNHWNNECDKIAQKEADDVRKKNGKKNPASFSHGTSKIQQELF